MFKRLGLTLVSFPSREFITYKVSQEIKLAEEKGQEVRQGHRKAKPKILQKNKQTNKQKTGGNMWGVITEGHT